MYLDDVAPGGHELQTVDHHCYLAPYHDKHHGSVGRVCEPLAGLASNPEEGCYVTRRVETLTVMNTVHIHSLLLPAYGVAFL